MNPLHRTLISKLYTKSVANQYVPNNPNEHVILDEKVIRVHEPIENSSLYEAAEMELLQILYGLEKDGFLKLLQITPNGTNVKQLLERLGKKTLKNSVEATNKKWKEQENVGSEITIKVYWQNNLFHFQIINNGVESSTEPKITRAAKSAGWESTVSNQKSGGTAITFVLPIKPNPALN